MQFGTSVRDGVGREERRKGEGEGEVLEEGTGLDWTGPTRQAMQVRQKYQQLANYLPVHLGFGSECARTHAG